MKVPIPIKPKAVEMFELNENAVAGIPIEDLREEYYYLLEHLNDGWNSQFLDRIGMRIRECKDRFADEYLQGYKDE